MSAPADGRLGRELRATLVLAAPLIGVQLLQMSMSFVDVLMVGRLGTAALAAAVLGSTVFFTSMLMCIGVILAVNPTVAQADGAGDADAVGRAARQGIWLAVALGAPLTLAFGYAEPALLATGQAPETAALAADYLAAIRWGLVPNLALTSLRGLLEGLERPRAILVATALGTVLNVGANEVLMYGRWGLPALGLEGTGWSSTLVMAAMFVGLALWVAREPTLARYRVLRGLRRPDPAMLGTLARLGVPIGVTFGLEAGLFTAGTLLVGRLGETALAAHQIALNAASVTFMVPLGIGMAATVRVGQAVGAGAPEAARRAGWVAIGLGTAFMVLGAALFWLRPGWVVRAYAGAAPDPDLAALAAALLGIAAVFQLVDGLQATAAGALRGLKDTRVPMVFGAVAYWGVGLSVGAWLAFSAGMGARGLWWGLTAGLATAAVLLVWRFAALARREIPGGGERGEVATFAPE